jgi:RND superfamily putative drug exporter
VQSLGHYAYRRRGRLLLISIWMVVACALGASAIFDRAKPFGFQDPDSESSRSTDVLEEATGERVLPDIVLLVESEGGSEAAARAAQASGELMRISEVTRVVTPADDRRLTTDGERTALVLGFLSSDTDDVPAVGEEVEERFGSEAGVTVGGAAVTSHQLNSTTEDDLRRIEIYAAPLILLLSLVLFRGLVAASLPLVVGAVSILTTLLLLGFLSAVMEIDVFAINIVTALGLGLAIDYSLFLVSRFREELETAPSTEEALASTMSTTGRMIIFSGLTVAAALLSLCIFPQRFLYSIGVGGALVAIASTAVCLLVLPAVLAMLGPRVNALAPPWLQRQRNGGGRWLGLSRFVCRHPISVAAITVALMVIAGLPFLRVELTRADATVLPSDSSAREVDSEIRSSFPADPASRIVVVVDAPRGGPEAAIHAGTRELRDVEGVDGVGPPVRVSDDVVRVDAQLTVDQFSDEAVDAADRARSIDWGGEALVGGPSAELTDQRDSLSNHLPTALAFLIVTTVLILFFMTRSVALPLVSLVTNALTVSVAFGVLVLVFQDGHLEGLLGFTSQKALDSSMPILLFAVAFGLSTDYGVFLLQRIQEARRETDDHDDAIAIGLARSGGQITAAALLFAVAMGVFVFSELVYVKEVAIGTAVAVLVDATIVRAFLLPAILSLLGPRAWWAPGWAPGAPREELR